ncbi:MAG: ParB N-terminal domain-containing protein [Verrucomicrobiae bacterium]|nr:ParB N-terminal domain-containing protein [Verrucomicrobiae bacterium]
MISHRARPVAPVAPWPPSNSQPLSFHHMKPISKREISYRPLEGLTIHPTIADDPRLATKDPRYTAMRTAWRESGVLPPLLVTPSGQIVDGRHRFWYAQDDGWDEVPCVEVTEDEIPLVILQGLVGKNHVTKGQRAYLAAPRLESAFEAAHKRRVAILQSGGKAKLPPLPTIDEMADKLGIGRELLNQSRRIHTIFTEHPKGKALKKEWEPKILDGEEPMGLGTVLQGIGGQVATKGDKRKPARNSALNNFLANWRNLTRPAAHWQQWSEIERDQVADGIRKAVVRLHPEVLDVITSAIRAERKARSAEATADKGEA